MAAIPRPKLNKVPGGGMPLAAQECHVKDLTKLTRVELLEIKEREGKLLANKAKLNRLPDKGKRIQDFYDKVLRELERRSNVDEAAAMFSELNIASKGKNTLNQLEWNGALNGSAEIDPTADVLDSDDETEMDPLRIIAQRTMHERKTKVIPPEPSLITAEDLDEIKTFTADSPDSGLSQDTTESLEAVDAEVMAIDVGEKLPKLKPKLDQIIEKSPAKTNTVDSSSSRGSTPDMGHHLQSSEVDPHVRYLVEKEEHCHPQREKFKPYKTTISNVHDPEKEKQRKKGKHWEVTAATPPLIQHSATKMLNLLDSVDIQMNYLAKLKELQEKQAAERLAARIERLQNRKIQLPAPETLKSSAIFNEYRTSVNQIEGDQRLNETEEVHDPLDEEKPSGVRYVVYT